MRFVYISRGLQFYRTSHFLSIFKGLESSNFKKYTENNCRYECHVNLAKQFCKCIPWDYIDSESKSFDECDVFGRTCFWKAMKQFSISQNDKCPMCKPECDFVKFEKLITNKEMLATHGISGGKYYNRQLSKLVLSSNSKIISEL